MNRAPKVRKADKNSVAPARETDKLKLSDGDKAALLARLESIERNLSGVNKQITRLREVIKGN